MLAVALGTWTSPVGGQGGAPPILLVVNTAAANPYGGYLAEILRAEGIQSFTTVNLSSVDAPTLAAAKLVVLAETPLTAPQVTLFTNYVNGGGRLVAMRPDAQLATLLGISILGPTTTNGYVLMNQAGPGAGLQNLTLPFKGAASNYALAGATSVASLYSTRTTDTGLPAVVTRGRTAAWSFDLARSTAYTRQGDPAFAGQERDGISIIRTTDIFFNNIDLQRVGTPHADVQMRLFSRVIAQLLADTQPLPRLWYFPGTAKTILLPTSDSHTSTVAPHQALVTSAESKGARISFYFSRYLTIPPAAGTWRSNGHELGLHPFMTGDNATFPQGYQTAQNWFATTGFAPPSPTERHHSVEWLNWTDPLPTLVANNIRMDTSYYAWGPTMYNTTKSNQAHGYITGSGLPMRFVNATGAVYPVYQQVTSLVDEQLVVGDYAELLPPSAALAVSQQLIDDSQNGGYSAVMAQFHVDYYQYGEVQPWVDGTMAYAQSLAIPMWATERWLRFTEARAATAITNVAWSAQDKALSFNVTVPVGGEAQTVLVPANYGGDSVTSVVVGGQAVTAPAITVNGQTMRAVSLTANGGASRSVAVLYAVSTPSITIADVSVTEGNSGSTVAGLTVTLSSPTSNPVSVAFTTTNGTAQAGADYTATSGTLNFAPFQTSQVIPVSILGDLNLESTETFSVVLSNPSNATIADSVGIVSILDDDAPPAITIADATVTEGSSGGTTPATFVLSIAGARGYPVTVQYATANQTATAGADYTGGSGTVTFPAGTITQNLVIPVTADTLAEPDETFVVNLSNATNGVIADAQALGTIVNDDSGTATITATYPVTDGDDDVNEESGGFTNDSSTVWVGNASAPATSWGGFRFTNVTIPPGAVITSARLELQAASTQWLSLNFDFGMEASANSAPFSAGSKPSQRTLLAQHVTHASDVQWVGGTWYQLDQLSALLQGVVNQPAWASGNAASVVVHGAGSAWARKFANAFDSAPANAPRLVVTYTIQQAAPPSLSVSDVTLPEGNSGSSNAVFTVSLSAASTQTVSVDYATADGTATAGSDYTTRTGTVTFTPGTTSQQVSVPVAGDTTAEANETFTLGLSGPTNATIADGTGQATITNDDAAQSLSIGDVTVAEGNAGSTPASFTVTLTPASSQTVTVAYTTATGTATSGSDFTTASGTLTFAPGVVSQPVTVSVLGDALNEVDETFTVVLSNPTNAGIGDGTGLGTITNDDAPPALAIDDVTVPEGNTGTSTATFTVGLSPASGQTVTVAYATANGTATSPGDYATASGTLTFAPGVTSQTVAVTIAGDTVSESSETFSVNLSAPVNASIDDASGLGTISNDDGTPALSVDDVSVAEGQTGTASVTFTVSLAAASGQTVTVDYATADATATAGSDYAAATGTLTFTPGVTTQQLTVTVNGDVLAEANETFAVTLSNAVNASLADATGVGTITNDDGTSTLAIDDVTVAEGNAGSAPATFTVTLSPANGQTVTVAYTTADGSAAAGSDYTATSGTLTFAPGVTAQTIAVPVSGDTLPEANETFTVALSAPTVAVIGDGSGAGTITNDDGLPVLSIADVAMTEGDAPGVNAVLTVTLSSASGQTVTVGYATANQTATAGADYTATSGTVTFEPGVLTQTITVPMLPDTFAEPDETFAVTLATPVGATIAIGTGVVTLTNDDTVPALTIDDVTVAEGQAGLTSATFTVTLSLASPLGGVSVDVATADGTATAGSDYTGGTSTLTFGPGVATQTVVVPILGDTAFEAAETFAVTLANPVGATVLDGTGTGTITNDDAQPSIAIDDVTLAEGDAGVANATFTVSLSAASSLTTTVAYTSVNGTAAAGSDFTGASGTLTFAPGVTAQTITVPLAGDTLFEATETFTVVLSSPTNATLTDNSGLGTITNDDAAPSFSIDTATVAEGNSGTTSAVFTVTLSAPSGLAATVDYVAVGGSATAVTDFTAVSGTLTFAAGVTSQTVSVPVLGDTTTEADETFTVQLSAPGNATIAGGSGLGTITNDDAVPTVNIGDATVSEGNAGTTNAVFAVTLSNASSQTITVDYATQDGTAAAGSDYAAGTGTLSFAPGVTSQSVTVVVNGDAVAEATESFAVALSNVAGATLGDASGVGTITNDDALPTIAVGDATVTEGNAGTTAATFTVTLSAASGQAVTVDYATADGSAAAGSDYAAGTGTLTFAPGVTAQAVTVTVNGDVLSETNETFTVGLSTPSGATIADASGLGTITNDDATPSVSIGDATVTEGNAGTTVAAFAVTLSAASGQTVTVGYATANGTATAGSDYTAATGTLTFAPGVISQTVSVNVTGDTLAEANETFTVALAAPTNATLGDASGLGTISNDDLFPTLNITDVAVTEGNSLTKNAAFTVTLTSASTQTVTVAYATANVTATAGTDYNAASGTLTFAAGVTSQTLNVVVRGDTTSEPTETYTVTLSSPVNAIIGDGSGLGTITNDDALPTLAINDVAVTEGNTGSLNATFTITLSASFPAAVTVNYATAAGTATAGVDYTTTSGTATIAAGTTTTTVVVPVLGDILDEANETYTVALSTPANATIADASGTGTITDNDATPTLAITDVTTTEATGVTAVFTVTLSAASGRQVTVNYATANGTASATSDFTTTSGTLTFAVGVTSLTVTVPVVNNALNEATETFNLGLSSATNATIADTTGVGTILDDDPMPTLTIADASVSEGGFLQTRTMTFTVSLSTVSGRAVTVNYATANGTATSGSDYTAKTGTVTIAAGATSATFTVTVTGDLSREANETFLVNLSNAVGATVVDAQAVGTILNDD